MKTTNKILLNFCFILCFSLYACEEEEPTPTCNSSTLSLTVSASQMSDCDKTDGSITLNASGGAGGYMYELSGSGFQANVTFSSLAPGLYTAKVQDADGCTAQVDAKVASGLVLADVKSIIETNCAVNNCHDGSRENLPNFNMDATIRSNSGSIRTRTGNKSMPPSTSSQSLTDEEIQLLACWVDDGAN